MKTPQENKLERLKRILRQMPERVFNDPQRRIRAIEKAIAAEKIKETE